MLPKRALGILVTPVAASALLLALASPAAAAVIYEGTNPGTATCPNGTVTLVNDAQEGRIIKTQIREASGKERCEFVGGGSGKLKNGMTVFIGYKTKMITPVTGLTTMLQLKSHGQHIANHPLLWQVDGRKTMTLWNYEDVNGKMARRAVWSGPVPQNTWFSLIMKVHYSESRTQGSVQLWINGRLQTLKNGTTIHHGQTWDGSENNVHFGIYRSARHNGEQIHYFKRPTIATTMAEVNPDR